MSFKIQASSGGGKELAGKQVIHHGRRQIKEVHVYNINSLLQVEGLLGGSSVKFLLDSGAAVSATVETITLAPIIFLCCKLLYLNLFQ